MTIVELRRELADICERYGVTEAEIRQGSAGQTGRMRESQYVEMARGAFIVRACELGLDRSDLAGFLHVAPRSIGRWRTELIRRGLIASRKGKVRGERPECYVSKNGRAA